MFRPALLGATGVYTTKFPLSWLFLFFFPNLLTILEKVPAGHNNDIVGQISKPFECQTRQKGFGRK